MINKISTYFISLLLSLIVTWTIGLFIIIHKHYLEEAWITWVYGLINTILAVGFISLIIGPFFFLGKKYKITHFIIHFTFFTLLTIELISLFYFAMTLELLGSTIFQFSFEQASIIIDNYFTFEWHYLLLPLPIVIYFLGIRFLSLKKRANIVLHIPFNRCFLNLLGTANRQRKR